MFNPSIFPLGHFKYIMIFPWDDQIHIWRKIFSATGRSQLICTSNLQSDRHQGP